MSVRLLCSLALLATAALSCTKLNSGRCDHDSDCQSPYVCNSSNLCVPAPDGGMGGRGGAGGAGGAAGAAGAKGTGGKPFSCADTLCPAATPICDMAAGKCKACYEEGPTACKDLDIAAPLCVSNTDAAGGPLKGSCVGCLTNANCTGTPKTPICSPTLNTCVACGPDSDCAGVGPGVCLTDGRCATESETIFVQNDSASCSDASALAR